MSDKPERCPLCGHANEHDRFGPSGSKACRNAPPELRCICLQLDYLAALRGYHSRDEEIAALNDHIEKQHGTLEDWIDHCAVRDEQIATLKADNAELERQLDKPPVGVWDPIGDALRDKRGKRG